MAGEVRAFVDRDLDAVNRVLLGRSVELQQEFRGLPSAEGHHLAEKLRGGLGAVAYEGDRLVGLLVGHVKGSVAKVPLSGCLAPNGMLLDELYSAAAQQWLDAGASTHEIYAPATERYDAGFRALGFGHSATQLMIETERFAVSPPRSDLVVRPATLEDEDARLAIERDFMAHVNAPPSFSALALDPEEEIRQELQHSLERVDFEIFVAELGGEVVGELLLFDRPQDGERIPLSSVDLAFLAVRQHARGQGIGMALAHRASARAKERSCAFVTMDVRTTNRSASRFWERFGFTPVIVRVERTLATA